MPNINNLSKLVDSLNRAKTGGKSTFVDPRFYKPKFNDSGTSNTIIRFIRPKNPDDAPIVTYFSHKFEGLNGFYYENCPTTVGEECPVCQINRDAYNSGDEIQINRAKARVRKQKCVVNILVVKDPLTPENNGKVFLFEMDKKMLEKIIKRVTPSDDGVETPCDIFDPVEGANFKLIGSKKTTPINGKKVTFPVFDDSSFADPTALSDDFAKRALEGAFSLDEFIDPSKFKSFTELEQRLMRVMNKKPGAVSTSVAPSARTSDDVESESYETPGAAANEPEVEEEDSEAAFLERLRNGNKSAE